MRLILTTSGVDQAVEVFDGFSDRLLDDTPAMEGIQQIQIRSAQQHFVDQASSEGPWQELAESTIKRRRNTDPLSILILRDTGYLMQSLSETRNEFSLHEFKIHESTIGTNRPGASNHNIGVTLPKRTFLEHTPENIEDYKATYTDFLFERGPFSN